MNRLEFHPECAERIEAHLGFSLIKFPKGQCRYHSSENEATVIISVSKRFDGAYTEYWFTLQDKYITILENSDIAFVAFGCGSSNNTFLIPYEKMKPILPFLDQRGKQDYFVRIREINERFIMHFKNKNEWMLNTFKV